VTKRVPDASPRRTRWLPVLLRLLGAGLLTCVVAAYNRFPITFPDSGNYLDNAISLVHGREPWFFLRPVTYGVFLMPFSRAQTLWLLPLAQGIIAVAVIDLALRVAGLRLTTGRFLALIAGLSLLTSLPWFSGQIMPDIFTGLVILLCYVLFWGDSLPAWQRGATSLVLAGAIAIHLSHLPLYAILAAASLGGLALAKPAERALPRLGRTAVRAAVPLLVAMAFLVGSNWTFHRRLVLSRSSSLFALAHLVGTGAAQRYLASACGTHAYRLCAERDSMVASSDWFLWAAAGTRKRHESELARGDSTFLREAPAIVSGAMRQEWPALLGLGLRNTPRQLALFEIQPGEHRFSPPVEETMRRIGPMTLRHYLTSREVSGSLPVEAASRVQYVVVGIGLLALVVSLGLLRGRRDPQLRALLGSLLLGVVINAFLTASLSSVQARYQSRVMWLVPLAGTAAALRAFEQRRRARTPG
jgi:hypothetical protein